jgi:hypothetical protein
MTRGIGQLSPGQAVRIATGLGPFSSTEQFQVGVARARVLESRN